MGRYAQARKRGRGINSTALQLGPPLSGDWALTPSAVIPGVTFTVDAELDGDPPTGADGYAARFSDDATSWIVFGPEVVGSVFTSQAFAWGDTAYGEVAWFLGATQVSNWSTAKTSLHP